MNKEQKRCWIKLPIRDSILDSWARMAENLAQAAFLAIMGPAFLAENQSFEFRLFTFLCLLALFLVLVLFAAFLRDSMSDKEEK